MGEEKEREKALAIDTNLSQNQWGGMTGAEYRTSVQPNLMKKFNLTKQEADLEAIGYKSAQTISLSKVAREKGRQLDMDDFMELHG